MMSRFDEVKLNIGRANSSSSSIPCRKPLDFHSHRAIQRSPTDQNNNAYSDPESHTSGEEVENHMNSPSHCAHYQTTSRPSLVEKLKKPTRQEVILEVWKAVSRFMHRFRSMIDDFSMITKDKEIMTILVIKFSQALQLFQAPTAANNGVCLGNDHQLQWFFDQVLVEVIQEHIDNQLAKQLSVSKFSPVSVSRSISADNVSSMAFCNPNQFQHNSTHTNFESICKTYSTSEATRPHSNFSMSSSASSASSQVVSADFAELSEFLSCLDDDAWTSLENV
jgi:hypothetical protein